MLDILKSMLGDGVNGSVSSKRVITFLAFLSVLIGFFANLFFNYKVDASLLDVLKYVIVAGLAATASEKFT